MQLHADDHGRDRKRNLDKVFEDRAPDVTLTDNLPVLDLQVDDKEGVDAADEPDDREGSHKVSSLQHLRMGTIACRVDLEGKHFKTAGANTARRVKANLHKQGDKHVMGGNVEDQTNNADLEGAQPEEVCLLEQIFELFIGLGRGQLVVEVVYVATAVDQVGEVVVVEHNFDAVVSGTFPLQCLSIEHANWVSQGCHLS